MNAVRSAWTSAPTPPVTRASPLWRMIFSDMVYSFPTQIRNPNLEIRNKSESHKFEIRILTVWSIRISDFEFVSDFDIRISDLALDCAGLHEAQQVDVFVDDGVFGDDVAVDDRDGVGVDVQQMSKRLPNVPYPQSGH